MPKSFKSWTVKDARVVMEDINKFGLGDEYNAEEKAHARKLLKQSKKKKQGLGALKSVRRRQKALDVLME